MDSVATLAVDPVGNRIFVGDMSGEVSVRDVSGANTTPPFKKTDLVADIELSPTSDVLAIADYYGAIHVYNVRNEIQKTSSFEFEHKIIDLEFSDDGARLYASGSSKGDVEVVSLDDNRLTSVKCDAGATSTALCVDSSRGNVVVGFEFGGVEIVSLDDGQVVQNIETPKTRIYSISLSPHGRFLAFGGDTGVATVWDMTDRAVSSHAEIVGDVRDIEFLNDQYFAVVTHKGWLQIVDAEQGTVVAGVKAHSGWATSIDFSSRSAKITTGGEDGKVHQWRWSPKLPQEIHRAP